MRSTLALSAAAATATACNVPPLSCFGATPIKKFQMTVVGSDLSSVEYNSDSNTLFAVNNGAAKVFEVELMTGKLIDSWDVPSLDPEGISWLGGRRFAITDENPASIHTVTLRRGQEARLLTTEVSGITPAAAENLGFEGVTYIENFGFLAAQEMRTSAIWKAADGKSENLYGDLLQRNGWAMLGDITRSCQAADEFFLLVKEPKAIHRVDLATGRSKEQYAGLVCDMGQPEGITFVDRGDDPMLMVVVGEPLEVLIFEADPNCANAMNSTTERLYQCPQKDLSGATSCDKTVEDGGCPQKRCNKALTNHVKICTDTEPGVTDCSLMECKDHCTTTQEFECTHYAWDEAERECYIFEGCVDESFDEDYVQYAMFDPTCERTLEDYPLGCEQRRCSKSQNMNDKICSAKSGTACTLEECKQKCEDHLSFTCTTYSLDPSNGDCYVWESCEGEENEPDYNTYVLVDPTCGKDASRGGCPNRVCSSSDNLVQQVCSGTDEALAPCSAEECKQKCMNSENFVCTHYAHDSVDSDCLLFDSCLDEGFHDDFTTFVLPREERRGPMGAAACELTLDDGGCDQRRCSKKQNVHNKICEGESGTSCSIEQCESLCDSHEDFHCQWFSFDPAEGDCYIWESCEGEGEEPEYTNYRMRCHATVEDGGCPARRCAKKSNEHNKICDAPDTSCSLAECEAICESHEAFACTHFSFDPKAGDCYIWAGCAGEGPEFDYTTYVVSSPASAMTQGKPMDAAPGFVAPQSSSSFYGNGMTRLSSQWPSFHGNGIRSVYNRGNGGIFGSRGAVITERAQVHAVAPASTTAPAFGFGAL